MSGALNKFDCFRLRSASFMDSILLGPTASGAVAGAVNLTQGL